jgi:AraC-like DNA-binding protein
MEESFLKSISPKPALREYINRYEVFRFLFNKDTAPPPKFHAPRPEHCITFYIRDLQRFSYIGTPEIITYPRCVINGMHIKPVNRYGGHDFLAIKSVLQPTALFRLTNIPMTKLTNNFFNSVDVWGTDVESICDKLVESDDLAEMIDTIETFIESLIRKVVRPLYPIDRATSYMLHNDREVSLHWLADESCLSMRQFIRKFEESVGVSPKMFNRIIRFDKSYRMKNNRPANNWPNIAFASGYYDYQHLVKDYKKFTNQTPPAFYEFDKKAPERSFGLFES